ncbi:MAG TPA: BON domain-containing protein [Candidatus Acidoferrum sp.]
MKKQLRALCVSLLFVAPVAVAPRAMAPPSQENKHQRSEEQYRERLAKQVRHELVMLPWYSVFDNLAFRIDRDKVTLLGQVTRPVLKSDAEAVVKRIEGVASVKNDIEVLPLSPMDDQLRRAVFRAIYGGAGMQRYANQPIPSIHIIVKNGNVTLEGVVDTEMDRNIANLRANQVPNVFSVKNNLVVATNSKKRT